MNIEFQHGASVEDPTRPPLVLTVSRKDDGDLATHAEFGGIDLSEIVSSMMAVTVATIEGRRMSGLSRCEFWIGVQQFAQHILDGVNTHALSHPEDR